jgi:hypothetical protein
MHSSTAPVIFSLKTTSNHKRVMAIDEHQRHASKGKFSRVKELAMVHGIQRLTEHQRKVFSLSRECMDMKRLLVCTHLVYCVSVIYVANAFESMS